jgi:hypothetical protein
MGMILAPFYRETSTKKATESGFELREFDLRA